MQPAPATAPIAGSRFLKRRFFCQRDKCVESLVIFMDARQAVFG
jgi:hypothetical protein